MAPEVPLTITPALRTELEAIAKQATAYCRRRSPWIDPADLSQEVWAAMLAALPTFDPAAGHPLGAYLYRAAVHAGHRFAWTATAPAHVPHVASQKESLTAHKVATVSTETLIEAPSDRATPESAYADREAAQRLAVIVARHLADDDLGKAARAVLFGELPAREAAAAYNVDVRAVYWQTQAAKRSLRQDRRLLELR